MEIISNEWLDHTTFLLFLIIFINKTKEENENDHPLHHSCEIGSLILTEFLVEEGFDIDSQDKNGYTPIIIASNFVHLFIVQYLC